MKKITTTLIAGLICWLSVLPAMAQQDVTPAPGWVSDKGYWVVESRNDSSIVYFYDNDSRRMYKEQLAGVVNTGRRKTKVKLMRALEHVSTAWQKDHIVQDNRQLLAGLGAKSISRQNKVVYRQMTSGGVSPAGQP